MNKKIDFSQIKLLVWDLDDTFWNGTLSEGYVVPIEKNIDIVRRATDCGIINAICSKNDKEQVDKELMKLGISSYFVFNSIDWTPKGKRISSILKSIGLRAENTLFIDDNIVNLNEALYYQPNLLVAEPSVLRELEDYLNSIQPKDIAHKRLANYKTLEQKQEARSLVSDNAEFLYSSLTRVEIKYDCSEHIDRIVELVKRTNQLNFTKLRSGKEEISALVDDDSCTTGYVSVNDRFGDYGIVGFFAIRNNKCIHFLFSCRTIGQGVEQYVYAHLNYPELEIVGDTANTVTRDAAPGWINISQQVNNDNIINRLSGKIVFKGACDLKIIASYLQTDSIIEEFTYIGKKANNCIEHHNSSVNYLCFPFLSKREREALLNDCVFNDEDMFDTSIYDKDVSLIILSTMMETNLGIYRNRVTGAKIAWGESLYPLTDSANWDLYINNEIFTADNHFTQQYLESFSSKYEFIGHLSPTDIMNNLTSLLKKIAPQAKVCLFLGSEIPFERNSQPNYDNRHLIYKQINDLMRRYAEKNDRILLVDFNDYIRGQEDFTNNINHFKRRVYYEAATQVNQYIHDITGNSLNQKGLGYLHYKAFIDRIGCTGFFQTRFYSFLREPYCLIKSILG